jgi:WD40 repeat protein
MFEYLVADTVGGVWMSREAWVYFAPRGQPPRPVYDHEASVTALAVTAAGAYVASGDQNGEVLIYGTREHRYVGCIRTWGGWVTALSWDLDGEVLTSVSMEHGQAALEHWRRPDEPLALHLDWPWDWWQVTWAPDCRAVAWIEEGDIHLHQFATGQTTVLDGSARIITPRGLAWSPDARFLAVYDGAWLDVWNPVSGTMRARAEAPGLVCGLAWVGQTRLVTAEMRDYITPNPPGWLQEWRLTAGEHLLPGRAWCEQSTRDE